MNTQQTDSAYIANTYARFPVAIHHGKGSLVWDEDGKQYIDLSGGIAVNTSVNKQLFAGITRVKEYLGARPPKIYVFRNCVNLIRELKGYWWGDGDVPVKRDDHALDELRYYIMSRPVNKPRAVPKSRNAQYKEKLLRESRLRNKKF